MRRPVEAARELAPELSERALEMERLRTMPPDLVEKLHDAGLFHLAVPAELGGPEHDPFTILEVVEELSRADGSAGWTAFINNSTSFVAWLEPDVAKRFVAEHPRFIAASMFAPSATARPVGGGLLRVDGRWPFNSGSPHADFLFNGVMVMDGDVPRRTAAGIPDHRFAVLPRDQLEVLDNWNVSGLRGTGSHDVVADGALVPEELTFAPLSEPARLGGPLFRLPFPTLLGVFMGAFPLGVARRAVDEFVRLAATKGRSFGPSRSTMLDDESIVVEVARAEALVRSARGYLWDAVGRAWETVTDGDDLTLEERADVLLAVLNGCRAARAAVDAMFGLAGGGALFDDSPLQRCSRDVAAGTAHIFMSHGRWKDVGRILTGREPSTPFV